MQAVLLCGGLGTRLRSVVSDRPKPLADVCGKPFMEYVIRELIQNGITDIVFAVGYKGSMVEEYFKDGSEFGFSASYAYEEEPLGTAGAIRNTKEFLKEEEVYVLNADTFYRIDYKALRNILNEKKADMSIVVREVSDISRYGAVTLRDGRITAWNEKSDSKGAGLINGGIYVMKKEQIEEIPEGKVSLENEMIPKWLNEGKVIAGIVNTGYFIDIGVPESYAAFQEDVRLKRI